MDYSTLIGQILLIVGIMTVFVNIITEVMKKSISWISSSKRINIFVLILSVILSVGVFIAYWQYKGMVLTWYMIAAFIIIGFMVAYAAMFGYDKLIALFKK